MSALLWVAAVWLTPSALIVAWIAADTYLARREADQRHAESREVSPEWLAVLAATEPTPVCDALVCEHMERAEGWSA